MSTSASEALPKGVEEGEHGSNDLHNRGVYCYSICISDECSREAVSICLREMLPTSRKRRSQAGPCVVWQAVALKPRSPFYLLHTSTTPSRRWQSFRDADCQGAKVYTEAGFEADR